MNKWRNHILRIHNSRMTKNVKSYQPDGRRILVGGYTVRQNGLINVYFEVNYDYDDEVFT
jgi:hypothetical protein